MMFFGEEWNLARLLSKDSHIDRLNMKYRFSAEAIADGA